MTNPKEGGRLHMNRDTTKNLEGVRVGDEVVHFMKGCKGTVVEIGSFDESCPLIVAWKRSYGGNLKDSFTLDGRYLASDIAPSIGFALPKVEYAPRPKKMVKKEIKLQGVNWDWDLHAGAYPFGGTERGWKALYESSLKDKPSMTMTLEWEEEEV